MQFWQTYVGKSCFLHVLMLNMPLSEHKEMMLQMYFSIQKLYRQSQSEPCTPNPAAPSLGLV